jgi:UDP-N-acetylmuramoyl-L-alanyl-D-glutamate--2,6-diaminopimelate ligase
MRFQQLLDGVEYLFVSGDAEISGIDYDSRRIQPGYCFVAMKGEATDGNLYIDTAIEKGAVAVINDSDDPTPAKPARVGHPANIAWARVKHGRRALARASANFYGRPAERLMNTGVTGTNGKTTTSFLVESILHAAARKTALLGTVEYHVAGHVEPAPHTTPEALEINQILSRSLRDGASEAVMEVSSHALAQERVYGIPYDVAMFTNLTQDHLDYHKSFDEYFRAKRMLFEGVGTFPPRAAVLNVDDEYGRELVKFCQTRSKVFTFGWSSGDFHAQNADIGMKGTRFDLVTPDGVIPVWSPMIGRVNVYNILAAAAAGYARDCTREQILAGIERLACVPGRFEKVDNGQPFTVVVDYAHTDDALRNLTRLAREFVSTAGKGKVITVFGCGGDRDRAKRPKMGQAAGEGSDFVILTSDNPRSEDPMAIIDDAKTGLERTGCAFAVEPDRARAIQQSVREAKPGDIVLLAGKGHEKVQVTRAGAHPFDDVQVARAALAVTGYAGGAR